MMKNNSLSPHLNDNPLHGKSEQLSERNVFLKKKKKKKIALSLSCNWLIRFNTSVKIHNILSQSYRDNKGPRFCGFENSVEKNSPAYKFCSFVAFFFFFLLSFFFPPLKVGRRMEGGGKEKGKFIFASLGCLLSLLRGGRGWLQTYGKNRHYCGLEINRNHIFFCCQSSQDHVC